MIKPSKFWLCKAQYHICRWLPVALKSKLLMKMAMDMMNDNMDCLLYTSDAADE